MNIFINSNLSVPSNYELEVVERKGVGHPDTLADGIAEKISVNYSQYCLKKFGVVLHHNVDKICIMGGLIKIYDWGLAKMVKPIRVLVNGRISPVFNNEKIPLKDIFKTKRQICCACFLEHEHAITLFQGSEAIPLWS